ncbi:glycosyltransferase family 2 protein [Engelhardtia mirabilis]|uniref:Glycosyl transferase family 2 n=1 Tax=Engelhardtia mirabilis TaxID=2528011 RepID=A0A518BNA6_9BACT|nr:Glycosyl transferase family 2 [Planctomycetes bacterium Pla133]QDV02776.1 Glycosyl transferase family 2 [Planctomycetes bacterium Pla86]
MTAPQPLTGVVVTLNEEDRLADCLRSLDFCDELLVIDSHSTDRTRELAAEFGAQVIERDWPGFMAQKEFGTRAAQNDWVLFLDADERLSATLRDEIVALRAEGFPARAGWRMPRTTSYLGAWIRHGTWTPDLQLRLFDRRRGHYGGTDPHAYVVVDGPVGRLAGTILHDTYRNLGEHLAIIDRYTEVAAERMSEKGRRARPSDLVLRPAVHFLRAYLFKLGFLDGWRGLLLAYLGAHYVRLKYARLMARQRSRPTPRPDDACPGTFGASPD